MAHAIALHSVLENARRELLDLTSRNRLLNTPRGKSPSTRLEVVDELSHEVFRRLVVDGKSMSFLPAKQAEGKQEAEGDGDLLLSQPDDDELDQNGLASRHTDDKLQTQLASEQLQRRLLKLYYDAKTYEQEQGVNILYVALGFLKWFEDDNSDRERYAPLLLVPVTLDRQSATSKFRIRFTEDDIATNLSLQERLRTDFRIALPEVPDLDELSPADYYAAVAKAVRVQPRWQVLANDIVLWFFSFSKFLMYRDLIPDNWPDYRKLECQPLIRSILEEGFRTDAPLCGENEKIDPLIRPLDMVHVVDADSSQALVIEEVNRGRNLVIQGPPGTGKSQTIANLIAGAVKAGKSVLFVAEKMAALEVVKRRLSNVGLGDMCLELHSNKANKRTVLQDLERTLKLDQPKVGNIQRHCAELDSCRERLNRHLQAIHSPIGPSALTPYQIMGELVRLRAAGTRLPDFKLGDPRLWTHFDLEKRLNLLQDLLDRVAQLGAPHQHPWRGVELDAVLPTDVDRISASIPGILSRLARIVESGDRLAQLFGVVAPRDALATSKVARLAHRIVAAPEMDRACIASPVWQHQRQQIDSLVEAGKQFTQCQKKLHDIVVEAGWQTDVAVARRDIAAYGRSWFRFLSRKYRDAQRTLRGIVVDTPPKKLEDRLEILDHLIHGQKVRDFLLSEPVAELGRLAFGSFWNSLASDWIALAKITHWETECREASIEPQFRAICARVTNVADVRLILQRIAADLKPALSELNALFESLKLNLQAAFGSSDVAKVTLSDLRARLQQWRDAPESLSAWVNYLVRLRKLQSEGMAELAAQIDCGETAASEAVARCEMAFYEELIREAFRVNSELAAFTGSSHERLIEKFRELDAGRIDLARYEVASAHYQRLPTAGSDLGEVGLVRREIQKKRRHLPIRRLLSQAAHAVRAIKPVFMMSPISVAQFLEPGAIEFDLLLIDEASQVQPVDALGAAARAKQIVVVGDSKQLPPTRFFTRMLGEDGSDELEQADLSAGDMESILGLCCAQNVPQRMLRWHYRSRHHSLIAVSNHEFYEDRLHVVPSPGQPTKGQGLIYHFLPDGKFDRGGSATNRVEARIAAEAVMTHAHNCPNKSLGVGAFSVAQRDAILDELELLRRADPSVESFFATATAEPFFVKNLENIQGDERDVIYISVGYGKDESGYMAMTFGPLSTDGGERRLNVLITRAKESCNVFASFRAEDIDLERARSRGAQALKTFLKYAESGLLDTGISTNRDYDSEFERQVARALSAHGFETHAQVGVAGFFIDLAVLDPSCPGRYLLGIECDGLNYHRSRSARDRDRLREAVLRDRGWVIHRIWSTDWFHRPDEQIRKTLAAIESTKAESASRTNGDQQDLGIPRVDEVVLTCVNQKKEDREPANRMTAQPYIIASFRVSTDRDIHELPASELARVVARVVEIEGPIHGEEIARRVTRLWGLQRTGKRISDAVECALAVAISDCGICRDGPFYMSRGLTDVPLRNRGEVDCGTLRRPEMIPPQEIRNAILAIVRAHLGVESEDAIAEASRLLGFRQTSGQLFTALANVIDEIANQQLVERRGSKLYPALGTRDV